MGSSPTAPTVLSETQGRSSVVEHRKTLWSQLRRSRFCITNLHQTTQHIETHSAAGSEYMANDRKV